MITIKRSRLGYLLLTLLGSIASAAFADHKDHADSNFKIPRAELLSTVKTIGIMPITVASEVPGTEGVSARYEGAIVARFEGAGFP